MVLLDRLYARILRVRGQIVLAQERIEDLPPNLRRIAERYRQAVADVLGVPPEAIREDVVVKWVRHWAEAYVKPEYLEKVRARLAG